MQNTSQLDLALVVTTHNSMRTIARCLESARGLARRIHVVDSGSTDGTIEACRKFGAEVVHHPWQGYAKQKEFALSLAATEEWVLLLDSDESLEPDLQKGLREAIQGAAPGVRAIEINRKMWYEGGWIHHVGFPDWVVRCGRRGALGMVHKPVHERVEADGPTIRAAGVCRHESWDGVCDAMERAAKYARLSAEVRRPKTFPLLYSFCSACAIVFKHGLLRGGFLDGWRGMVALVMYAIGRFANTMATFERSRKD
ncbi:MAG: glycosyltransferase family 2 protein [Planctomycetes bacterium]|nr:glycosyltransferase family 2 protein [Planctomycetota bacterium]